MFLRQLIVLITSIFAEVFLQIMEKREVPFRPHFNVQIEEPELIILMKDCWNEDPLQRPTMQQIKSGMKKTKW